MKRLFSILFVVTALAGCGSSPYKYFGKSYAPTTNAEMFFREADIPEPFEIMGKMDIKMSAKKSTDKIQRKVMQIAAQKGADAVIVDNFDQEAGGFSSVGAGGGKSNRHGGSVGAGASKTKINQDIVIKATLVKYKKNIPGASQAPAPGETPAPGQ